MHGKKKALNDYHQQSPQNDIGPHKTLYRTEEIAFF
jgi:hypothetical protein